MVYLLHNFSEHQICTYSFLLQWYICMKPSRTLTWLWVNFVLKYTCTTSFPDESYNITSIQIWILISLYIRRTVNQIWLKFWQKYIQIFPFFVSKEWLDHMKITIVFQGIVVILLTIIIKDVGVLVNSKSHFKTNLDIREKTIKCSAMHPNFPSFKYREDLCCYKEKFRGKSKSIDLLK